MAEERLQKILSRAGIASRRHAEELIEAGEVTINGRVATLGDKADPENDAIKVGGRRVPPPVPHRYLLLHKPDGYVSTVSDPEGRPTVLDLIPARFHKALVPVGRLDFHTEGLLLLTTDGSWAQKVAHPRHGSEKVYHVKVAGVPDEGQVDRIRGGMVIDGERTLPAEVARLKTTGRRPDEGNSWWEIRLRQGRTRQIREMFFRIGHPVQKLRRVAIGALADAHLPKGAWRELTEVEVAALRRGAAAKRKPSTKGSAREGSARGRATGLSPKGPADGPRSRSRRPAGGGKGRSGETTGGRSGERGAAGGSRTERPRRGPSEGRGAEPAKGRRPSGKGGKGAAPARGDRRGRPPGGERSGPKGARKPRGPKGPRGGGKGRS